MRLQCTTNNSSLSSKRNTRIFESIFPCGNLSHEYPAFKGLARRKELKSMRTDTETFLLSYARKFAYIIYNIVL